MKKLDKKAEYSQHRNDMFWKLRMFDENMEWVSLTWTGHNDAYWWNEVAQTESARTLTAENGRRYYLDFDTNEVYELDGEQND